MRTPAGDPAWLVTSYEDVRALFGDSRLGRSHPCPERVARFSHDAIAGGPIGEYATETADHARMRELATPLFSRRRIRLLRPRITEFATRLVDELEAPADLHERYSVRLPVEVICELLGVPAADRPVFRRWADESGGMTDQTAALVALQDLLGCMAELIAHKRRHPADDAITELSKDSSLSDEQMVFLCTMLLFAGFETTVARIDFGALLLMTHPEQRTHSMPAVVEEILRYSAPSTGVIPRYAHAPVELDGQAIEPGELVLLGFEQANRDPSVSPTRTGSTRPARDGRTSRSATARGRASARRWRGRSWRSRSAPCSPGCRRSGPRRRSRS